VRLSTHLEVAEHPLDGVALTVKPLAVADRVAAVRFRRDDDANAALLEELQKKVIWESCTPKNLLK
jgi:hypothetical protein